MLKVKGSRRSSEKSLGAGQKKAFGFLVVGIVVVAVAVVLTIGGLAWTRYSEARVKDTNSAGSYSVEKIGELDVTSVYYDKILNRDESKKLFGITLAKESSLYIFHFKGQIYYDLTQSKSKYNEEEKTLKVTLPKPQVKLLMKDSGYSIDYEYFKASNSMFIKDDNNKGLEIQKAAIANVEEEILGKEDFVELAQSSVLTILKQMYAPQEIQVECEFL